MSAHYEFEKKSIREDFIISIYSVNFKPPPPNIQLKALS